MQYFESIDSAALRGVYLAIGSFDGLHRGHRRLLDEMIRAANEDHAPSAVLTFFPHPRTVLERDSASPFRYLLPLEERIRLLRGLPLDAVIVQPFTRAFSEIPAGNFLPRLRNRLELRSLWCGPSFSLGKGRTGDVRYLTEQSVALGFSMYVVPPLSDAGGPITSNRIRRALSEGDTVQAAGLLGRRYAVSGKVVHGAGRGRSMGFPTANIEFWPELVIPAFGVYATWAIHEGNPFPSATSIGVRPTFSNGSPHAATLETHLLDFSGDLYGSELEVEFVRRLREEKRFPDQNALCGQMTQDIDLARRILQEEA
jgi:riboflavin kinase/FMN adenylyltransferase